MSNSKKESREVRIRNYSFSNNQSSNPSASELDKPPREPLRETEVIRNFSPSRYQPDSKLKMPPFTLPPEPTAEELYSLHQEGEIRKLQEVIYYLTGDKDILKQECTTLNLQVASLTNAFAKERQSYEAEVRKLKEMIKDKESQVGSIGKAARKEREIYEQENERMKTQLKLLIQKKNDEIYAISREKDAQNQQIRKTLENAIEELKGQHAKALLENDGSKLSSQEEIVSLKDKNQRLEEQLAANELRHQQQKLKLVESHQLFVSDLKQNYHQTKMQLIQASKDQVAALQRNSEIQREVFLLEISNLKNSLAACQRENEELQKILFDANRNHEADTQRLTALIQELQRKLAHIHSQKEKELQFLKVKVAHLHQLDLQSASQLYSTKISHNLERFAILEAENKRLREKLQQMLTKNKNLILQLAKRGSLHQEQLANLKVNHSKQLQYLNSKAQAQKADIHNQTKQSIKESENKSQQIRFQAEQLRKLRQLLDSKTKEVDEIDKETAKIKAQINQQRERWEDQQNSHQRQWHEERQKLKQEISSKSKEIQRLNNLLVDKANQQSNFDYTPLENEVRDLRQQIKSKSEDSKIWKSKAEDLRQRLEELTVHQQSLKKQIEADSNELRAHWQEKAREKAKDTENFYQRKIQILIFDKEQLKTQNDELQHKIHQLTDKCDDLDNSLKDLLSTYKNRSQLQAKIISLGLDINLIKNKQQLFQY